MPARQLTAEQTHGVYSALKAVVPCVPCASARAERRAARLGFRGDFRAGIQTRMAYGRAARCSSSWLSTPRPDRNLSRRVHVGGVLLELGNNCAGFQTRDSERGEDCADFQTDHMG